MTSDTHNRATTPEDEPVDFERLFLENQRAIYSFIFAMLSSPADAEDIFQNTCLIMLKKSDQYRPATNFLTWARQIAQYEVFNYRRRQQTERLRFGDDLVDLLASEQAARVDDEELRVDAMRQCVEKLRPDDRELVRERYRQNITSKQLAAQLGRPPNTVYKALARIRGWLEECVERVLAAEERRP